MKNIFILLLVSLFLVSCATYKTVKVPVVMPSPPIKLPSRPDLPIYYLNDESSLDEVAKAYVASIYALQNHITNIEMICTAN